MPAGEAGHDPEQPDLSPETLKIVVRHPARGRKGESTMSKRRREIIAACYRTPASQDTDAA